MNELQIFNSPEFGQVRTIVKDNEAWFVGKDVAEALKYSNTNKAIKDHVDEEDKQFFRGNETLGLRSANNYGVVVINESGVFSLAFSSKLPKAKEFKRWITKEVIPSIRKHGGYLTPDKIEEVLTNPDTIIKLATELKQERAKRIKHEQKIEEDKPKVIFAEAVKTSQTSILVGELAKILKQNGYDTGEKRLFSYLRENGYLVKQKGTAYNTPTQKSMNLGLFEIEEKTINKSDGILIKKTPKVTGKGQIYFVNKFKKKDINISLC